MGFNSAFKGLIGRWMEPELCLDSVEKITEKHRSHVIELLITVISEFDFSFMQNRIRV